MGARLGGKGNPVSKQLKAIAWIALVAIAFFMLSLFAPRLANELLNAVVDFFRWIAQAGADERV